MTRQQYSQLGSCASYASPGVAILLGAILILQPACSATAQSKAIEQLAEAEELLSQQKYDEAAKLAGQAAEANTSSYSVQQLAGQILYRSGHSQASLPCFERAVELAPSRAADNWQRGIALGSCGKFEAGAAQFKTHHDVNPDDVENSAWYFLCIAKTKGIEAARQTVIPSLGDSREPMMSVLKMLQGKLEPEAVLQAAVDNTRAGSSRDSAMFYADLYVGLYYDALGEKEPAVKYLRRCQSYGISGYMADTARVYLADRFPDSDQEDRKAAK